MIIATTTIIELNVILTNQHPNYSFHYYLDVDYIVSPYESDAQLAHLSKSGSIDAVISEDRYVLLEKLII